MTRRVNLFAVPAVVVAILACGGGEGGDGDHPNCDAYLDCVADVEPSTVATEMEAYGSDAACWEDDDSAEACESACADAQQELYFANPTSDLCDDGSDLPSSSVIRQAGWQASVSVENEDSADCFGDAEEVDQGEFTFTSTETTAFSTDVDLEYYSDYQYGHYVTYYHLSLVCTNDGFEFSCTGTDEYDSRLQAAFTGTLSEDFLSVEGTVEIEDGCVYTLTAPR